MPVHSAGILPWLSSDAGVRVFIAHMGGPFWARKDEAAWSVVKGEFDPAGEDAADAARREFTEETGLVARGDLIPLGEFRVTSSKVLHAFACRADSPWQFVASNTVELEWPPRSGRRQAFPEVDRADWMTPEQACPRLVKGQRDVLDALLAHVGTVGGDG